MASPFAVVAALISFGKEGPVRLKAGLCPRCGGKPIKFRDKISEREFDISGLCQACQDVVFGRTSYD
jgi:hypothetical protein